MIMNNLEFMSKFKPTTRCIKEFKYWIVCIRGKRATLGDAVILLKRETPNERKQYKWKKCLIFILEMENG